MAGAKVSVPVTHEHLLMCLSHSPLFLNCFHLLLILLQDTPFSLGPSLVRFGRCEAAVHIRVDNPAASSWSLSHGFSAALDTADHPLLLEPVSASDSSLVSLLTSRNSFSTSFDGSSLFLGL